MHNPFVHPRPNAKRDRPRRTGDRVRLGKEGMGGLRWRAYQRAGGLCECDDCMALPQRKPALWIAYEGHPDKGDFAHDEHGARKSDELARGKWMRHECHMRSHNPKACPRKPGRRMNTKEAEANWKSGVCFCTKPKRPHTSLCEPCLIKLEPQLQFDVQNATGKEYLEAMALAEQALLTWKTEEIKP